MHVSVCGVKLWHSVVNSSKGDINKTQNSKIKTQEHNMTMTTARLCPFVLIDDELLYVASDS